VKTESGVRARSDNPRSRSPAPDFRRAQLPPRNFRRPRPTSPTKHFIYQGWTAVHTDFRDKDAAAANGDIHAPLPRSLEDGLRTRLAAAPAAAGPDLETAPDDQVGGRAGPCGVARSFIRKTGVGGFSCALRGGGVKLKTVRLGPSRRPRCTKTRHSRLGGVGGRIQLRPQRINAPPRTGEDCHSGVMVCARTRQSGLRIDPPAGLGIQSDRRREGRGRRARPERRWSL
jgi:hypothetical protein